MITKVFKVTVYICFFSIVFILFQNIMAPNITLADGVGDIVTQGDDFVSGGKVLIDSEHLKSGHSLIYNILLAIGTVLTVLVGGYLGIQFMIASADDKAKIKEKIIPFILGCVVIYGAFGIWKLVVNVLDGIA